MSTDDDRTKQTDNNTSRDTAGNVRIDVNIGGIFKGLGGLMEALNEAAQQAEEQMRKANVNVETSSSSTGTAYGFSFRTDIGGTGGGPHVRTTVRTSTRTSSAAPEAREPLVDVFDEGDEILVIVELPGVSMADIRIELNEDVLALETTGERRYVKEILLPAAVDTTMLQQTYRNGILEVRLHRQTTDAE
ncbi:MAG: Hsp20/alpha crystallin family protein [Chloroflexaceae bacterium]|nr:Hsp20/alpha crystallin family protein [Chloroflexaceae bacterium]